MVKGRSTLWHIQGLLSLEVELFHVAMRLCCMGGYLW